MENLSQEETLRYSRHLVMPEVTLAGQQRLRAARVLLVGAGGLGSPAALYLAAAGVGTLGLVDDDTVDLSNIQRQVLYATEDVGRSKGEAAKERLAGLNPNVTVQRHDVRLDAGNVMDILADYDLVVDGSDNFPTRYLVNDACVLARKPCVYGSVLRFDGQVSVFEAGRGPCYRCLFPEPPPPGSVPSCAEGGVLGVLPGIVGALQGLEAIKWILGVGDSLHGRLLLFEGLALRFREVRVRRSRACPVCGDAPSITAPVDTVAFCAGEPAQDTPEAVAVITPEALAEALAGPAPPAVLDVRNAQELDIVRLAESVHIPLDELPSRLDELDRSASLVVTCHKGARAERAARLLGAQGFTEIRVLEGGIDAWAVRIDPGLKRYA